METNIEEIAARLVIDWASVENFFYRAMIEGWASNRKPIVADSERSFKYEENDFRLLDKWLKVGGWESSSGTTTIEVLVDSPGKSTWLPIWQMHYMGWYRKEASQFVKDVLLEAYKNPSGFNGCRGPSRVEGQDLVYENRPIDRYTLSSFRYFRGIEHVLSARWAHFQGQHMYFGMSLV